MPEDATLYREGEYWTIAFAGRTSRLKDAKGIGYLAVLLRHPGREVHVLDLVGAPDDAGTGEVWDAESRQRFRARVSELREEVEEAEAFSDPVRAERARAELDAITAELASAVGLGGRARTSGRAAERARVSVTKAIKASLERIAAGDPALGAHLDATIRTGTFCSYRPDPRAPVVWSQAPVPAVPARASEDLVGRRTELAAIDGALAEAAEDGGAFVLVAGEPGIGKTRLAEEALAIARARGFAAYTSRAAEGDASPYGPVSDVLASVHAAVGDAGFRELLADAGAEVAKVAPWVRRRFPDLPAPMELPVAQERRFLLDTLRSVFDRVARTPTVVLFDDVHWADEATLVFVEHLSDAVGRLPLVVVMTYRDVASDQGPAFGRTLERLVRLQRTRHLTLGPLDEPDVAALVGLLTGAAPDLGRLVYERTEGNPFFVRELAAQLPAIDTVPPTVRTVLANRLGALADATRDAVAAAAVLGDGFRFDALDRMLDGAALAAVEDAERAGVLVPMSDEPEPRYRFAHDLIRRAVLDSLSAPRRRRLHARAAGVLDAADAADHLVLAGAEVDAGRTYDALLAAGDAARGASAFEAALARYEQAMAIRPGPHVVVRIAEALRGLGRPEEAVARFEEAIPQLEAAGERTAVARVCREVCWQLGLTPRLDDAMAYGQRGLAAAGETVSAERVRLLSWLGVVLAIQGRFGEAGAALEDARRDAEALDDDKLRADVATGAAIDAFASMEFARSSDEALRAVALLRDTPDAWDLCQALNSAQNAQLWTGRLDRAVELGGEVGPLAARIGQTGSVMWDEVHRGLAAFARSGDVDGLGRSAARVLQITRDAGLRWIADAHTLVGLAAFRRGDAAAAEASLRTGAEAETGGAYVGRNHGALLLFLAGAGRRDEALALFEARRTTLPAPGERWGLGPWTFTLNALEAMALLGETGRAAALAPVVDLAAATGTTHRFLDVRAFRTLAAVAAYASGGDGDPLFAAAVEDAERLGLVVEAADALLLWSRCGRPERAAEAARRYETMRMPLHAQTARGSG